MRKNYRTHDKNKAFIIRKTKKRFSKTKLKSQIEKSRQSESVRFPNTRTKKRLKKALPIQRNFVSLHSIRKGFTHL